MTILSSHAIGTTNTVWKCYHCKANNEKPSTKCWVCSKPWDTLPNPHWARYNLNYTDHDPKRVLLRNNQCTQENI